MRYLCRAEGLQRQQVRTVVGRVNGVQYGVIVAALRRLPLRLLPLRLLSFPLVPQRRRTEALCFGLRPAVPLRKDCWALNAILFRPLGALERSLIQTLASILAAFITTAFLFCPCVEI